MKNFKTRERVNAGSMADIAFLLLIFFLVTTVIPNDKGIPQKLPRPCKTDDCGADLYERNILRIHLNKENEILVEETVISYETLKTVVIAFLDNNGNGNCDYCNGEQSLDASDHPSKAIISLQSDRETSYSYYIIVLNELMTAFSDLRKKYALNTYGKKLESLSEKELKEVINAYPQRISEAETH